MNVESLMVLEYNYADMPKIIKQIREEVFIDEQQVPQEMEWDEFDADARHFLLQINVNGKLKSIATARLLMQKSAHILGRMAVLKPYRRQGIGLFLLQHCITVCQQTKPTKIIIHAQVDVLNFYTKKGFKAIGEIFNEANIAHQKMILEG